MSAITSIGIGYYTSLMHDSMSAIMANNNARMNLINSMDYSNPSFGSLESLAEMDKQLELNSIKQSTMYQISKTMLESLKSMQKDDIERSFSIFA